MKYIHGESQTKGYTYILMSLFELLCSRTHYYYMLQNVGAAKKA